MNMKKERARRIVKLVILAIIMIPLFGLLVMALWNWLMPELFGLPKIGFLQAWGLFLLSKILFGSFRGQPGRHHHRNGGGRWAAMSEEEREAFRRGIRERHPHHGDAENARAPDAGG